MAGSPIVAEVHRKHAIPPTYQQIAAVGKKCFVILYMLKHAGADHRVKRIKLLWMRQSVGVQC